MDKSLLLNLIASSQGGPSSAHALHTKAKKAQREVHLSDELERDAGGVKFEKGLSLMERHKLRIGKKIGLL